MDVDEEISETLNVPITSKNLYLIKKYQRTLMAQSKPHSETDGKCKYSHAAMLA